MLFRSRVPKAKKDDGDEDDGGEDAVETDFGMIEGKEQDGISEWCRKYSKNFGVSSLTAASTAKTPASAPAPSASAKGKGKGKARATDEDMEVDGEDEAANNLDLSNNPMAEDEGDVDDDNYTDSDSELSDGSDSEDKDVSDDSAAEDSGDSDSDAEGEEVGDESRREPESEDVEDDDHDEEPLDPKHHPLLRPGAMPKKISKAALNAVVGMMEENFGMSAAATDAGDEEDELDDDEL